LAPVGGGRDYLSRERSKKLAGQTRSHNQAGSLWERVYPASFTPRASASKTLLSRVP